MPSFAKMFVESKGKPIIYKGQEIVMVDFFPITNKQKLKLVFESFNSEWKQGVMIRTKGSIIINGQNLKGPVVLWQDTAPKEVDFIVNTTDGVLSVKNIWDVGDGTIDSWHNGAAMIVQNLPNGGKRYLCNDGHPDENFNDIVFQIEVCN